MQTHVNPSGIGEVLLLLACNGVRTQSNSISSALRLHLSVANATTASFLEYNKMTVRIYDEIVGSTAAGVVSTILGHPLDTLKAHLQTSRHNNNANLIQTARSLLQRDKAALWRGLTPPLVNAIVMNTVMFAAFGSVKENAGGNSLVAGLVSGLCLANISTPTDLIKIQAQLHHHGHDNPAITTTSWKILRQHLAHQQGLFSLFRGHTANLCREGLFTMVYLGVYDLWQPQGFVQIALTSAATGAVAWIASYPFDTVKTVVQAPPIGGNSSSSSRGASPTWDAIRQVYGRGGLSAFYRGCLSSTGRCILVTSSRMVTYEAVMAWIR